jgi:hypothetical protein
LFAWVACADAAEPTLPVVQTEDVARFFSVFDQAGGAPTAAQLQRDYLDPGSDGLHQFVTSRIGSAQKLAEKIEKTPALFEQARACADALPGIRERLESVFVKLAEIYPPANFPPVTIVVGRGTTGGTTTPAGVIIGLETICKSDWLQPDITERFVHLIAHEYAHVQQPGAAIDPPKDPRLLYQALIEGGAEFVGEMISGEVANVHLQQWTQGQECRIEKEFQADASGTDVRRWLYNGVGTQERPGDLAYWVGYRIARAYYAHASDKARAIAELINLDDADAFLKASGWTPASDCGSRAIEQTQPNPATVSGQ